METQGTTYEKHQRIYDVLRKNGYIIFETVVGSQAHGTSTPKSDVDTSFIYIAPESWLQTYEFSYEPFLKLDKDRTGYELQNFCMLAMKNNPTIFELLFTDPDCHILKSPVYDLLLEKRNDFISKVSENSFFGYANSQITKATGMDKMQNWEKNRTQKKEPIDFCYVIEGYNTRSLIEFLTERNLRVDETLGLTNISHAENNYALFYSKTLPYGGIFSSNSHQPRLSSIPKGETPIAVINYNMDAYLKHHNDWKKYQKWLSERNTNRWVEVSGGNAIDAKNIAHLVRLTQMNMEIASGQGCNVRRPNREELLAIRNGKKNLNEIIEWSADQALMIRNLYKANDLPQEVDKQMVIDLLLKMYSTFYGLSEQERIDNVIEYDNKFLKHEPANIDNEHG